jgi:Zn-dependent protease
MGSGFNWWVAQAWEQGPIYLISWVVWVIGSIVLHELAHGWTALRLGDRTPIETGHMTWNPLVHMGQTSLIAFALLGIAWGQMPVDRTRLRGRHGDAMVSAAGPIMNLWLFVLALIGAALALKTRSLAGDRAHDAFVFFFTGAWLNVALALFNLLPVPPLDGSRILASFFPGYARIWQREGSQAVGLVAFGLLFFFGGRYIFGFAAEITIRALGTLTGLLGSGGPPPAP